MDHFLRCVTPRGGAVDPDEYRAMLVPIEPTADRGPRYAHWDYTVVWYYDLLYVLQYGLYRTAEEACPMARQGCLTQKELARVFEEIAPEIESYVREYDPDHRLFLQCSVRPLYLCRRLMEAFGTPSGPRPGRPSEELTWLTKGTHANTQTWWVLGIASTQALRKGTVENGTEDPTVRKEITVLLTEAGLLRPSDSSKTLPAPDEPIRCVQDGRTSGQGLGER